MLRFFISSGEPSGDVLGAQLIEVLNELSGQPIAYHGIGGERMVRAGLRLLFPQDEIALFGLFELVPHLPRLLSRIDQAARFINAIRPDAVITVDAPGFNFRVVGKLRKLAPRWSKPLIHYVAPSVWAWHPGRAKHVSKLYHHLLALLPFELPYFTREGLPCTFVGHPAVHGQTGCGQRFREHYQVSASQRVIAVLPGSRIGEVRRLLPIFRETVRKLVEQVPAGSPAAQPANLHDTAPTAAGRMSGWLTAIPTVTPVQELVRTALTDWPVPSRLIDNEQDKHDAFAASDLALSSLGSVTLELARAELPAVMGYQVHPLTAVLARRLVHTRFANLVNILHQDAIIPELIQERCHPVLLAEEMMKLHQDPLRKQTQIEAYRKALALLKGESDKAPSVQAAEVILRLVENSA